MTLKKRINRKWLRRLRTDRAWSIREAADAVGIPPSTYGEIERGALVGTKNHWQRIAKVYGIDISRFTEPGNIKPEKQNPSRALDIILEEEKEWILKHGTGKALKNFRPILTVTRDGKVTGNYWAAISEINNR